VSAEAGAQVDLLVLVTDKDYSRRQRLHIVQTQSGKIVRAEKRLDEIIFWLQDRGTAVIDYPQAGCTLTLSKVFPTATKEK